MGRSEKDEKTMKAFEENIRAHFQFLEYAPIVFLSAKTRKRTQTLIPVIDEVMKVIVSVFKRTY